MKPPSQESAAQEFRLRFFDVEVRGRSDSGWFIDLLIQMYQRFRVTGSSSPPAQRTIEFVAWTKRDNPWNRPVIVVDREVRALNDPRLLEGYAYETMLHTALAQVRSHFLIHAGVVTRKGESVILAADAGYGKTTLVLELIKRGFDFLSDEMAALGRADRRVHAFPRSLRVRPGTLELTGFSAAACGAPEWLGKLILDIEKIRPGCVGEAAPISHVVVLRDATSGPEERRRDSGRELRILLDHWDEALFAAVCQIEGVSEVSANHGDRPLLRLRALRRTDVLSQIEALCDQHDVLILGIIKREESQPTFETPARLEAIPGSEATMELVRRFQGGHKSALLQDEFGGSSTRLFLELAETIEEADCYRLSVGPLNQMADLVCSLVGA
jgi:hypothetical protein